MPEVAIDPLDDRRGAPPSEPEEGADEFGGALPAFDAVVPGMLELPEVFDELDIFDMLDVVGGFAVLLGVTPFEPPA